jgi:16S rRNA (uracil1498-N3)-methyltransferase
MAHFYLDESIQALSEGDIHVLSGSEARHAVTVSRIGMGERIRLGNGAGVIAEVNVVATTKETLTCSVLRVEHSDMSTPQLMLVQALAKGDRDERAIEAATELGVDVVIPWAATRSISHWDDRKAPKARAKWESVVREATKQSIRPFIPLVRPRSSTAEIIAQLADTQMIVLDPDGDNSIASVPLTGSDIAIVVGPEGGVSPSEIELFTAAGAQICTLGENILRTSTAGPAALAILLARLGRC